MGTPERKRHRLFVQVYILTVAIAFGVGSAFALGGSRRFSSASFQGLRTLAGLVPGGIPPHLFWGVVFLLFGVALILSYLRRTALHLLRLGFALYLLVAIGFMGPTLDDHVSALSGIVLYIGFAALHLALSDHLMLKGWVE